MVFTNRLIKIKVCNVYKYMNYQCKSFQSNKTQLINNFNEYNQAINYMNAYKYNLSVPLLTRIYDILTSTVGYSSHLSINVVNLLAESLYYNNEATKTFKLLNSHHNQLHNQLATESIILLQLLTKYQFLNGNIKDSHTSALKSIDLLRNSDIQLDERLYHASYGYLGIIDLLDNNVDIAEMNLQNCARWSFTKSSELISLNNLGLLHWIAPDRDSWRQQQLYSKLSITEITREDTQINGVTKAKEAIEYWEDAIKNALAENKQNNSNMCGPNFNPTIINPSTDKNSNNINYTINEAEIFANANFTESYVTILCNLHEAYESIGDYNKSNDYLLSALKIIDKYPNNSTNFPVIISRVRRLFGLSLMFQNNPISSEGMYRSALECYDKYSHLQYDPRNRNEQGMATLGYGSLLTKWDKREKHGQEYIKSASDILESLKTYKDKTYKLSLSLLLPEIIDID